MGVSGNTTDSIDPRGETLVITLASISNLDSLTLNAIDLSSVDAASDPHAVLGSTNLETSAGVTLSTDNTVFGMAFNWAVGQQLQFTNAFDDDPAGSDDFALEAITLEGTVTAVPEPSSVFVVALMACLGVYRRISVPRVIAA